MIYMGRYILFSYKYQYCFSYNVEKREENHDIKTNEVIKIYRNELQ